MPLSDSTLDALELDYSRLLEEATEAARESQMRTAEALNVARMLRQYGRAVALPPSTDDLLKESNGAGVFHGVVLDDQQLEGRILETMPKRESGFKPSELTRRLVTDGVFEDAGLAGRVLKLMFALEKAGKLKRRDSDKRFQLVVPIENSFLDDDDNLPF